LNKTYTEIKKLFFCYSFALFICSNRFKKNNVSTLSTATVSYEGSLKQKKIGNKAKN